MPISGPGSRRRRSAGFTVIELIVVVTIVAMAASLIAVALPEPTETRLDNEAARLASLLESARAGARASGLDVFWLPDSDDGSGGPPTPFRFVGLPATLKLPAGWLDPDTRAEVVGASRVVLGPDAILPPQRIVLRLGDSRRVIGSDGLSGFGIVDETAEPLPLAAVRP